MKVRYAGNKFDQKQLYAAIKCITQNWWTLGQKGLQFQKQFCKVIGRKYGVFVNSGSSANLLAVYYAKKLGYKKVITPVCGFPTTINAIIQFGLEPIFIDIDKSNLNLKISKLQQAAKQNPGSVLMFAHALGNPPNMDQVMRIVGKYHLYLIEDCCDALGSTYDFEQIESQTFSKETDQLVEQSTFRRTYKLGTFGELATYSFYPAHHISTGQGGFIATDDYEVYKTLVSFRDWGRSCICRGKQDAMKQNGRCGKRFGKWLPGLPELDWDHKYAYSQIGFNLKPLELQAAIGLQQIKKLPQFEQIRKKRYNRITNTFWKLFVWKEKRLFNRWISIPQPTEHAKVNWFCVPITVTEKAPFTRKEFQLFLQQNGIQTRMYFGGNILYHWAYKDYVQENYNDDYNKIHERFPNAKYVTQNTFFLGISQVITEQQIEYVCQKLSEFLQRY